MVITEVEDFIRKFHNGELTIAHEALTFQVMRVFYSKKGLLRENMGNIADLLGTAVAKYERLHDSK